MCWQVDPPGQRSSAHQHLDEPLREQTLHQTPVRTQHPSMVDAEPILEQVSQLLVPRLFNLTASKRRTAILPPF